MKQGSTVYYLLGDHLGSTAVTVNSGGGWNGEVRYKAFGETRYNSGSTPTTYRYTGQRQESALGGLDGLYFYNARWYDPALARFLSADTLVPSPGNPQSLNRYAYVLGNPLKYVDPTGHRECEDERCTGLAQPREWVWIRGYTEDQLKRLAQNQYPDYPMGCGPFAMAMGTNVLFGGNVSGADM